MKIKKRYFNILFSAVIALCMSLLMSFFMLLINRGLDGQFFIIWMKSFLLGFCIAFPVSYFLIPLIRALLSRYVE